MSFRRTSLATGSLLAFAALAGACSSKSDDCAANKTCGAYDGGASGVSNAGSGNGSNAGDSQGGRSGAGSSGAAGDAGAAGSAPACDPTGNPDSDSCTIDDGLALFVATTGDDGSDGTSAQPFATLSYALSKVGTVRRIYVCAGTYKEAETLLIPSGVEIYGGFTCTDGWQYAPKKDLKAFVDSAQPIAAKISNGKDVVIQDLRLDSSDADGDGSSSFGLIVSASPSVRLERVDIRAGRGSAGVAGKEGDDGVTNAANGDPQKGQAARCDGAAPAFLPGGNPLPEACNSAGGNGGSSAKGAAAVAGSGGSGTPGATAGAGATVFGVVGGLGGTGDKGQDGAHGKEALELGLFDPNGYTAASGKPGLPGVRGAGGGGGGASLGSATCVGASGGAGGLGGCGAAFGTAGGGGGASVAVLSLNSGLTIRASQLAADMGGAGADGGAGGIGGDGRPGSTGGARDPGNTVGAGGKGGDGGPGGNGGCGSGGSGGPSIALVHSKMAANSPVPDVDAASVLTSQVSGSTAGKGGAILNTSIKAPDGKVGKTGTIVAVD